MSVNVTGEMTDMGARAFAEGEVGFDSEGKIATYTVAPGDVPTVVGERLCIKNGISLDVLNHRRSIHPGQVLWLRTDHEVLWVPYYNPDDASEGFQQIPYQALIEKMGAAVDAGDLDAVRAIWADELSTMFTIQADIDLISQQIDIGDFDVLRQMFS